MTSSRDLVRGCSCNLFALVHIQGTLSGCPDGPTHPGHALRGRKKAVLAYAALYSASCLLKHANQFWILLAARLLSGLATALLSTALEAWVVAEHNQARPWLNAGMFSTLHKGPRLLCVKHGQHRHKVDSSNSCQWTSTGDGSIHQCAVWHQSEHRWMKGTP